VTEFANVALATLPVVGDEMVMLVNVNTTLLAVAVAGVEIVIEVFAVTVATVAPAGMPAPDTAIPTVTPEVLVIVMVVKPFVVLPVELKPTNVSGTLLAVAVALAEIVIEVFAVTAVTVEFAGMPAPTTNMPTVTPAVLVI